MGANTQCWNIKFDLTILPSHNIIVMEVIIVMADEISFCFLFGDALLIRIHRRHCLLKQIEFGSILSTLFVCDWDLFHFSKNKYNSFHHPYGSI